MEIRGWPPCLVSAISHDWSTSFASVGLPVRLETRRDDESLATSGPTTGAELAAYRIVQEALTNVVRHAGLVETVVSVDCAASATTVIVANEAGATPGARHGAVPGRGLIGMRERAAALGGTFTAGLVAGGGFEVVARLPVETRPAVSGAPEPVR